MAGIELLSDQGIRMDGRRPNELRKIECKLGISAAADGSAYFQQGNTKVIATIYGPHDITGRKSKALNDRAIINCQFRTAPFSTATRNKASKDGSNLSACVNAGTLALINAGVPLKDYLCACSAGFINETPLMDINHFEGFLGGAELNLAILRKSELLVCEEMTARIHRDHMKKIRSVAINGCRDIYAILDAAVRKYTSEISV